MYKSSDIVHLSFQEVPVKSQKCQLMVCCYSVSNGTLFTKPLPNILPVVGTTSETIPAASPMHSLKRFSGIVPDKVMERLVTVRLVAL